MNLPDIIHPKKFLINGYTLQVATYMPVTDEQAAKIAMHAFRRRKWLKKDLNKIHTTMWTGDHETLGLL